MYQLYLWRVVPFAHNPRRAEEVYAYIPGSYCRDETSGVSGVGGCECVCVGCGVDFITY